MKKKLLFVYDSMMTGGTTSALLSLFEEIKCDFDVSIILYENSGAFFNQIPNEIRILEPAKKKSILSTSIRKKIILFFTFRFLKGLVSYFKYKNSEKGKIRNIMMHYGMKSQVTISRRIDQNFDIAIGFMEGWSNEYVLSSKVRARKKVIWYHPDYKNCYLIPEIDRKLIASADNISLVSEKCINSFLSYFPNASSKLVIVHNSLSPSRIKTLSKEPICHHIDEKVFNLCSISRCDEYVKGLDRFIDCLEKLKNEGLLTNVKWHFIGDGKDFEKIQKKIENKDLNKYVEFYGEMVNPFPLLVKMNLFVLVSRYEGKPVSIDEAKVLNIPCFVTNYSSAPTQISNNVDGLIVENNEDAIYEGLKKVLMNKEIVNEYKRALDLEEPNLIGSKEFVKLVNSL